MGALDQMRRQTVGPPIAAGVRTDIPAGMGGGVSASASLNVGAGSDGRGALLVLTGGVIALVVFYLWTHSIQGGP